MYVVRLTIAVQVIVNLFKIGARLKIFDQDTANRCFRTELVTNIVCFK